MKLATVHRITTKKIASKRPINTYLVTFQGGWTALVTGVSYDHAHRRALHIAPVERMICILNR